MSKEIILSNNEIEFIKYTIIYPDIHDEKTMAYFKWRTALLSETMKSDGDTEKSFQFNRLREIEVLVTILCEGDRPKTVEELYELKENNIIDDFELEIYLKVWAQKTLEEADNNLHYQELKDYFSNQRLEDLDDPYVKDHIEELQYEYEESKKYERMYDTLSYLNLEHLTSADISMICLILFRERYKPAEKHMRLYIRELDTSMLVYLILKFGIDLSKTNEPHKQIRLAF